MAKDLKIGDKVLWKLHTDTKLNNMYEIIGSKETPYDGREASPFNQPIEVTEGNDFILKNTTPDGKFHPFQHGREDDLKLL